MGLYQPPVDLLREKRIDVLVANGSARTVEDYVVPIAHSWHQLDTEEPAQAEDRFALTLSIGMERVGLDRGAVPYQPVQDVDRLPDTARDEGGKQCNVAVGDVVIGDTAISAIADVLGADEIVFTQRNMSAIGDCRPPSAPELWQGKAGIGVDQVGCCRFEFSRVDVLSIDSAQRLSGSDAGGVTCGLAGSEVAAVAEHCEDIALFCSGKFRICAGGRPEVASVTGPTCAIFENVEQVPFRHASVHFSLERGQAFGLGSGGLLLQMGNAIGIDGQCGVSRKANIDFGGHRRQLLLQLSDELFPGLRHSESVAIGCQTRLACYPRQKLGPVVAKIFGAYNINISDLQGVSQVHKDADLGRISNR